jgi:hypothetical protein
MSIGRPFFYLATLLDSPEARSIHDRLALESDHPERKLVTPKIRRRPNSLRRDLRALEALAAFAIDAANVRAKDSEETSSAPQHLALKGGF